MTETLPSINKINRYLGLSDGHYITTCRMTVYIFYKFEEHFI